MVRFISEAEWKELIDLKTLLSSFLTANGEQTLSADEASKKIRKIRLENDKELDQHMSSITSFLSTLNANWSSWIPIMLFRSLSAFHELVSECLISISSIETSYKLKDAAVDLQNVLKSLKSKSFDIITLVFDKWGNHKIEPDVSIKDLVELTSEFESKCRKPDYYNEVLLWEKISTISDEAFEVQKITNPIRQIGEFIEIYSIFDSFMKSNKIKTISLNNFFDHYKESPLLEHLNREYLSELIFYLKENGYIRLSIVLTNSTKELKEKARQEISQLIESLYKDFILTNFTDTLPTLQKLTEEDVKKSLSRALMDKTKEIEDKLVEKYGNIQEAEKNIEKEYEPLYEILIKTEEWIKTTNLRLGKYSSITRVYQKNLSSLSHEFDRKIENYKEYADSVHDSHHRQELETILKEKIAKMEAKLAEYEQQTSLIIKNDIPQIQHMENMLINFDTTFKVINQEVIDAFKSYKEINVNVFPSIKMWEDKMEELKNRTIFIISNLFAMLFEKFKPVIDLEQNLFRDLQELKSTADEIPLNFSLDLVMPQKLTEKQLRTRIKDIDAKLAELDRFKEIYSMEKQKYQQILEQNLKVKKNLVSRQCCICHKFIDVVSEEEVIRCEFCGSMSHYLCGAWWIEKYNSCPVCNNSYIKPNSDLYDSSFD